MTLILSPAQREAREYYQKTKRPFALIDTDVAYEEATLFNIKKIKDIHKIIEKNSSICFEEATTPEAKIAWNS
jgi:hypothetical protein